MPHFFLYGSIRFATMPDDPALTDYACEMMPRAMKHLLWINFGANVHDYIFTQLPETHGMNPSALAFEIVDNPFSNECEALFENMMIGPDDYFGAEQSRLPGLQALITDMLAAREDITSLTLIFEDCHGDIGARRSEIAITPDQLLDTYLAAPRYHTELPNVVFTISRKKTESQ